MKDVKKINLSKISTTTKGAISGSNKANVNKNINVNKIKVQKVNVNNVNNSNKSVYKVVQVTNKGKEKLGYTTANNITLKNNSNSNVTKANITDNFEYFHDRTKGVVQGYTTTDKYHVMIQTDEEKHKAKLIFVDKKTGESFTMNVDEDCGHGNDLEWNPEKNELVIPYKEYKTGKDAIKIIKIDKKDNDGNFKTITKIMPFRIGAIAYDKNEKAYYVTSMPRNKNNTGIIRKLDANTLEMDKKYGEKSYKGAFDFSKENFTTQGMSIKNGKIYYVATRKDTWDNYIIEYDKKGKMLNKIKIPFSEGRGELESIKFDKDGQLYGNFITKKQGADKKNIRIAKIVANDSPTLTDSPSQDSNSVNA